MDGTLSTLLTQATSLFTWVFSTSLPTLVNVIYSNAILFIGFLITLCGLVVGMLKRLINIS